MGMKRKTYYNRLELMLEGLEDLVFAPNREEFFNGGDLIRLFIYIHHQNY